MDTTLITVIEVFGWLVAVCLVGAPAFGLVSGCWEMIDGIFSRDERQRLTGSK